MVLNNLGSFLVEAARDEEAVEVLTRAFEVLSATLGASHVYTTASLASLGDAHLAGGRHRAARDAFRRSATARKEDIGARQFDPLLFHALVGVGRAEAESGEPDAVHRAFEEALDLWNRAPEVKDPRLARSLSYLGDWLVEQQRCAAAVPLLRRAIELSTAGVHSTTLRDESERLLSACD